LIKNDKKWNAKSKVFEKLEIAAIKLSELMRRTGFNLDEVQFKGNKNKSGTFWIKIWIASIETEPAF